ncbi:MAG: cell division protein FtsZ [Euryarchaeota archaeon]|jgi:cell division protein FtsZ|nr:cell division protein FtsZ [Euryarchaeota archaeon]MBT4925357.1 cell division protein FtsZ [Euryarchaeota archaeon]MBT5736303.1 cell division protein FtsZ [Euryarchaeota archaeon]MBT7459963.1 cell division protein FtsZ [Euryarchaeota archaeon]
MRHLIERVLELSDEEQSKISPNELPPGQGSEEELRTLLESLQPRIRVYGAGGAGCNAINRLFEEGLFENSYVTGYAINTDAQALLMSPIEEKVLIGRTARGRGAGGDPTKGEAAALESEMVLRRITNDTQLAIITAGMGGGSGTGAAGHIARLAKQQGAMTIAVVTYPFKSEGSLRKQNAEWGLERLREHCDTILVIPNERLLEIEGVKDLPIASAFRVGDELLVRSITGVTELLTTDGMVNLDFEDLKAVIKSGSGVAMIGLGASKSANRAEEATLEALHSPLLELDTSDARGALINVVGGASLTLGEAEKCAQIIQEQVSPHAKIIWGAAVDESLGDEIRVMLVLTGVKSEQIHGSSENRQLRALRNKSIEFVN